MQVSEAIREKRAVRQFSDAAVSEDQIRQILNAGRRSQSSKNSQPWHFIVIRDRERLQALTQAGIYASHLAGAAFAVALVGEKDDAWNMFDLGQASAYMQLAAWELGIGSCIATFHHADKAKEILHLPEDKIAHLALSFGYPAGDSAPPRKGGRKPLDEVVKWETW